MPLHLRLKTRIYGTIVSLTLKQSSGSYFGCSTKGHVHFMKKVQRLNEDYREFIALLNSHRVKFLIVGGISFGFHAQPRYTKDLDVWISRDGRTAVKMVSVVEAFGFE